MENKVYYTKAINFINLFHTRQDKWSSKNKTKSRKMGLRLFPMYFGGWSLFALSQNANQALIFDHLKIINVEIGTLMRIRRYIESSSIIRPWFEGSFKNFVTQGVILMLKKFSVM